ncbi:hypothetical protein GR268_47660, partial [Rhizobium leguminosarum]|nr:hypothetical protein [Rhizobium leguminosarum]
EQRQLPVQPVRQHGRLGLVGAHGRRVHHRRRVLVHHPHVHQGQRPPRGRLRRHHRLLHSGRRRGARVSCRVACRVRLVLTIYDETQGDKLLPELNDENIPGSDSHHDDDHHEGKVEDDEKDEVAYNYSFFHITFM